jgi:Tol biopolymer transport system component
LVHAVTGYKIGHILVGKRSPMIGQSLSHYKILEKLGSGGMGDVYVAEDTKLSRHAALKILPPEMAENPERRMRFEREAKAIAALNHPNIVHVYSIEETDGIHFITMELVRGKTLTELIPKKGLPLNKFFEIAIPLADAVSAAHGQAIIHRDLKPDNLMVSDEGRLKILDFGLAKLKQEFVAAGASELPTQSATGEGRILGTVAYMSPEQAEGKTVDHRSDIFSIGTILYEMATGERPFKGDSTASIISSILKDTPRPATAVNPALPQMLGRIIRRCLVKDTEHRYQIAKDLRNELEEMKQEVDSGDVSERAASVAPSPGKKWTLVAAFVAVAVVTAIATYLLTHLSREEAGDVPIEGTFTRLTSRAGQELFPSLSLDGDFVVYASAVSGNWDIYLQRVGGENAMNLTEDSTDEDTHPAFSPDGKQIAFRSERDGGGIFVMGATGESVRRLTDFGCSPSWSPDGSEIAYVAECNVETPHVRSSVSQLWTVNLASGETRLISEADLMQPSWSPHGLRIAYWSIHDATGKRTGQRDIWTIPAGGGEAIPVTQDAPTDWNPVWSPDGNYIYFSSDRSGSMNLWRIMVDEASGRVIGQPEIVTTGATASHQHHSFSKDGSQLAYVECVESSNLWKVSFDPSAGKVTGQPSQITRGSRVATRVDVSPDGSWLAFDAFGSGREDIFVIRTDGTGRRQLTDDRYRDRYPRWSPDGKKIGFYSNRSASYEIWTIEPDGSGLQQLTDTPSQSVNFPTWSPDGSRMAYHNRSEGVSYIFDPNKPWEDQTPLPLPSLENEDLHFEAYSWSPDGRSIAGTFHTGAGANVGPAIYDRESKTYLGPLEFMGADIYRPAWLPDSRGIVFASKKGVYMADRELHQVQEILSDATIEFPKVAPDGQSIYFNRRIIEADIWLLTLSDEQ